MCLPMTDLDRPALDRELKKGKLERVSHASVKGVLT